MYISFSFSFIISLLLASAGSVLGGSSLWESKAPNKRTNPSPKYSSIDALNTTSPLVRRAVSITERPVDNGASRIWPNKKIRYCFDKTPNTVFKGLWHEGINKWSQLIDHGFSYEEVKPSVCKSQRSSVLRIYYNSVGRLDSSMGIPPIDENQIRTKPETAYYGPYTHLSDLKDVGMQDVAANIAHEIGHIWGLHHTHQHPVYWKRTGEGSSGPWNFPETTGGKKIFLTSRFNCQNLKDYDSAHAKMRSDIEAAEKANDEKKLSDLMRDINSLCFSQGVAKDHGFSASEWLPVVNTADLHADDDFDPDSIMLYPSSAGALSSSEGPAAVMVYEDGSLIPPHLSPSAMDINRLVTLYGNQASSKPGEPYFSKSSRLRNEAKRVKNFFFRAGDTKDGLCN